jgi:hypothetical protein
MLSGLVPTLSSGPELPPILDSLELLAEATLSCVMIYQARATGGRACQLSGVEQTTGSLNSRCPHC